MNRLILAAAVALSALAPQARADVPPADKIFASKAAAGGLAEVDLGRLAEQNAGSANVKAFAQRMVTDHTQANQELMAIASKAGLDLPSMPDDESKSVMSKLKGEKGPAFDKVYVGEMVQDHQKDVADFEKEATSGQDPALKNFAMKYLPVLKQHLTMAESLRIKVALEQTVTVQCGYCTPGQILSAIACITEGHAGSEGEIREYMSGSLPLRGLSRPGRLRAMPEGNGPEGYRLLAAI